MTTNLISVITKAQQDSIKRLSKYKVYFAQHSSGLFEHESKDSNKIITIIESKTNFSHEDMLHIVALHNEIGKKEHLNGSGWFDFQLHLGGFFSTFGYDSRGETTDILTINKKTLKKNKWWQFW